MTPGNSADADFAEQRRAQLKAVVRMMDEREQDFFDAGGDSITAVQLTTEVQRYLNDTVFLAA